jgi:ABC-type phosphate transport system substrate-binding protein
VKKKFIILALGLGLTQMHRVAAQPSASHENFCVIANPGVTTSAVDRRFLAAAFLKKVTHWPDGELIRPADLSSRSGIRRFFSEDILERSVAEVKIYWQQLIFSGRDVPPPEFASERDVVSYVLQNAGAIGYVSDSADIGDTKLLTLR